LDQALEGRPKSAIGHSERRLVYRGMSSASWSLQTSLARKSSDPARQESLVFNVFCRENPEVIDGTNPWNAWCQGQHHGLPTRLLDWTRNPDVALHFASDDLQRHGEDGVVWIADYVAIHARLPRALLTLLGVGSTQLFTFEVVRSVLNGPQAFDGWASAAHNYLMFFENPSTDRRIASQAGLFSLISDPRLSVDDLFPDLHECFVKVIVRKELKGELRRHLDNRGRNEAKLFPDSLDGLCDTIARQLQMGSDPEIN
jgi:hypothetical protein